jgi:spore germination protein
MFLRRFSTFLMTAAVASSSFAGRATAWLAPWDTASLSTLQANAGSLTESNPVWYSMSSTGAIVANWNAENTTWRSAMAGTAVLPTIQNVVNGSFSVSVVESLLATSSSRETHAEAIRQLVIAKGFDGIDIDYERVPATSRANFTAFIELLATKLHSSGKQLSVTVYPKTSEAQNWNGPGSQDWPRLGAAADSIKIMAYDYHWSTSEAGPLTPLDWLESVAAYAVMTIPATKITVGLPWYGYDWQGSVGKGVTYAAAMATAQAQGASITRDGNGELTYKYADHTVYFQDAASYDAKVARVRSRFPQIDGFAHWRVGQEDPAVWASVKRLSESATFGDVSPTHPFHRFVEVIARKGITGGCGGGNYCPDNSITRGQMAVFLLVAKYGTGYQPAAASGKIFSDVTSSTSFAAWIEQLSREGAAPGCGGNSYCPNAPVTREEMALMLLRAKESAAYLPSAPSGRFSDVPVTSSWASWVEELARRGITGGCSATQYCPTSPVTRGQMAVFLTTTFSLS